MVSALDFPSGGRWFEPSLPSCCFLRQETLLHIVSLHPGVQMGTGDNPGGVTLRWAGILSRGEWHIRSRFMLQKPELSAGLMGHLASKQTYLIPSVITPAYKYRKTKTKVITLTNHNRYKQRNEPIRSQSKYMQPASSAGKRVRASRDWFWFYL